MRGVVLPEGRHKVEFSYDPLSFKVGASISLLSLIFAAGLLIRGRKITSLLKCRKENDRY